MWSSPSPPQLFLFENIRNSHLENNKMGARKFSLEVDQLREKENGPSLSLHLASCNLYIPSNMW